MRFLLILVSLLAINAACAESARVGIIHSQNYPPYVWWDEQQQQAFGYRLRVTESILKELGVDFVMVDIDDDSPYDFNILVDQLKRGTINLGTITKGAAKDFDFLYVLDTPIMFIEFRVFVHKDRAFEFNQWSDLKGRRGLLQAFPNEPVSTTQAFDSYARTALNIKKVSSLQAMIEAVEKGDADYLISIYRPALIHLRTSKKQDTIIALNMPVARTGVYWAIPKNSSFIKRANDIELLLKQYREQGRLDFMLNESMQRYLINAK